MSDADNEKNMSTEEDIESFSRLPLVKTRTRKNLAELRYPRQKFCARWEKDFPWLKADKVDESVGICTVCNKHLVCKKSHLERHQRSYKHQRLQGFEAFDTEGDISPLNSTEFLECGKRELDEEEEFEHAIEMDPDYNIELEVSSSEKKLKCESENKSRTSTRRSTIITAKNLNGTINNSTKMDRFKLLKRIDRDRNILNEYYCERQKQFSPTAQQSKDPFDLFFESVSATVKTLPPKLAAEVKSRVSQLVAEFELRAICEREIQENGNMISKVSTSESAAVVIAGSTINPHDVTPNVTQESAVVDPTTGVPHIVYTFQPKTRE